MLSKQSREETSANLDTLQQGLELIRKPLAHVQQNGYVWGVAFSPDGRYLVTAGQDKKATVYDITGKKVKEIDQGAEVWAVSFSKKGKYLGIQTDDWAADTTLAPGMSSGAIRRRDSGSLALRSVPTAFRWQLLNSMVT